MVDRKWTSTIIILKSVAVYMYIWGVLIVVQSLHFYCVHSALSPSILYFFLVTTTDLDVWSMAVVLCPDPTKSSRNVTGAYSIVHSVVLQISISQSLIKECQCALYASYTLQGPGNVTKHSFVGGAAGYEQGTTATPLIFFECTYVNTVFNTSAGVSSA